MHFDWLYLRLVHSWEAPPPVLRQVSPRMGPPRTKKNQPRGPVVLPPPRDDLLSVHMSDEVALNDFRLFINLLDT
ncbi:hypothetical protein KQX54_004572 [Cotesia glomerata]|uniref:Uncharacterized protein n=1 Tax=Cotesia glomerata TaxID=32391 RepID=A0AAV7I076_COTGL|nr:hypothetical protein KQX54_004572 [Cotesia glomerata]